MQEDPDCSCASERAEAGTQLSMACLDPKLATTIHNVTAVDS